MPARMRHRAEERDEDEGEAVPREDVGRQARRREEHHRQEPAGGRVCVCEIVCVCVCVCVSCV